MKTIYGITKQNLKLEEIREELHKTEAFKDKIFINSDMVSPLENFEAIVRKQDNSIISINSDGYVLINHLELFEKFYEELTNNKIFNFNFRYLTINNYKKHNKMKLFCSFPDFTTDVDGSNLEYGISLINSTDGSLKYTEAFEGLRLVCTNGMVISEILSEQNSKHSQKINKMISDYSLADKLEMLSEKSQVMNNILEKAINKKITEYQLKYLYTMGFPVKCLEDLSKLYELYHTVYPETIQNINSIWTVYQILTNWISNYVQRQNIMRAQTLNIHLTRWLNDQCKEQ